MNLVVSLYVDSYQDGTENRKNFKHISWSPYDRITMRKATSFKDLCAYDTNSSTVWNGVEQKMHLVGINKECNWEINEENEDTIIKLPSQEYNYYCIISLKLDYRLHYLFQEGEINKDDILEAVNNTFKKNISDIANNITYERFKSLGAEDLVIILLSDSISDIIKSVPIIKGLQCTIEESDVSKNIDIFSSVCTFVGPNKNKIDALIDTDIIIRFNLKSDNADEFLEDIKKEPYFNKDIFSSEKIFCGKTATQLKISKNALPFSVFGEGGIFNESNKEIYTKYVNSSRTYFVNGISDNQKQVCYECKNRSFKTEDIIPISEYTKDSFHSKNKVAKFLDREYVRLLTTPRYYNWHKILKDQWTAMKSFSKYYQENDKTIHCEFLNALQVALLHINQACSPVSETPYHNYFYAGSYNDLLMMYYGIIYKLFNIADSLPHAEGTKQHDRKFAICFESTAKIHSTLYTQSINLDGVDKQERFIVFYLPYDSFWNYSDNIKYLIHEVFHYIAPYDRDFRAEKLIDIIFKKMLQRIFENIIQYKIPIFKNQPDKTKDILKKMIEQYMSSDKTKVFYDQLKKVEFEFFTYPNPEWETTYFKNNGIEGIVEDVTLYTQNFITDNFNVIAIKASLKRNIEEINEYSNKISDLFCLKNLHLINDELKIIKLEIIEDVHMYMKAAKEAFCDFWAVNILGINASEYIEWLFSALDNITYEGMSSQYWIKNNKEISLYSFEPRIWLMLYLFHKNRESAIPFNNNSILQIIEKSLNSNNIDYPEILEKINLNFNNFYLGNTYVIDDLSNIAFYNQTTIFKDIESKTNLISDIRKVAGQQLDQESIDIQYIEEFTNINKQKYNINFSIKNLIQKYPPLCIRTSSQELYFASSIEEYIHYVCEIINQHKNRNLWFRGLCNKFYSLLPSLFRNCDSSLSLYANQANILKYAYYLTPSLSDLWTLPIEQQMACLQHYGMATNLLDFSLDMLVALHFALNPDNENDRIAIEEGKIRPVVYVFDPVNYSNAIFALKNESLNCIPDYHISPVLMDINNNLVEKGTYFLNDVSFEYLISHTQKHLHQYVPSIRTDPYPAPIIIQQTQPRIIAQNGTFVVYSLHASPQKNNSYDYLDLISIQNQYTKTFNVDDSKLFLRPIFIDPLAIHSIRDSLQKLNIGSTKVYPELGNVFREGIRKYSKNQINGA